MRNALGAALFASAMAFSGASLAADATAPDASPSPSAPARNAPSAPPPSAPVAPSSSAPPPSPPVAPSSSAPPPSAPVAPSSSAHSPSAPARNAPTAPSPPAAPPPSAPVAPSPSAPPPPTASSPAARVDGLAVLAVGDAAAAAWPLARAVYADPQLRPSGVDDAHARVLAGEAPAPGAPKDLADLAETRGAIRGDDAPSRQLLAGIATELHVRGIVVVMSAPAAPPFARVFLADGASFDAARYAPDARDASAADAGPDAEPAWSGAAASLARAYGARTTALGEPASQPAPAQATAALPAATRNEGDKSGASRPFYSSPWFWAAIGAAAFGGAALYFATRDNGPGTIHLQLQVPK